MYKNIIILFIISVIFFIIPVNAEFINGDFETGTFAGWTEQYYGPAIVNEGYNSIYAVKLDASTLWLESWNAQTVDLTDVDRIQFDYKCTLSGGYLKTMCVYYNLVDTPHRLWTISTITDWQHVYIDVSELSGNNKILFTTGFYGIGYYDNIQFAEAEIETNINFNPDIDETENMPLYVNFSINETCFSNIVGYNCDKIYMYRDGQNTNVWYLHDLQEQNNYNLTYMVDRGSNCTYEVKLWSNICGFIASDTIDYIFNDSIEPFPTPQPTPNFTPVPTYTPPPTPIPPSQPNVDNGSLNMTWLNGYYNLVDSITNGLFHPIYNMTAYAMMPVNILSGSISGLMNQMELTFDVVTNEILTATSILNILFNAMPSKILNVITYYLLWIVILLVVKGDT